MAVPAARPVPPRSRLQRLCASLAVAALVSLPASVATLFAMAAPVDRVMLSAAGVGGAPVGAEAPAVATILRQFPCIVTGYYSPVPGQRRYATGTYRGDIRLNGRGTNGASGRQVFVGMIAAPRTYAFGTRIDVPGFGVGEVQDRGGAIVGNRIDLWMGRGDAGLARALTWGKRRLTCRLFATAA